MIKGWWQKLGKVEVFRLKNKQESISNNQKSKKIKRSTIKWCKEVRKYKS